MSRIGINTDLVYFMRAILNREGAKDAKKKERAG
jgi:hypothetical protein